MLALALLIHSSFFAARYKIDCTSTAKWINYRTQKSFTGTIVFELERERVGVINVTGLLKDEDNNQLYHVQREIVLVSHDEINSKIAMDIKSVHKHISDTAPDQVFNKNLIDTSARTLYLGFKKMYNAYLISTPYSAAFMCINRDR
ncbi:hypothetical protein TUM12370_07640 [Salmonella enterica subsp. enterica serovar Choleraesuis]|nr:hypothetical protein TUM12370_07640 [Salmonella enterica subsp. enterica serovar Choleraesuis]